MSGMLHDAYSTCSCHECMGTCDYISPALSQGELELGFG